LDGASLFREEPRRASSAGTKPVRSAERETGRAIEEPRRRPVREASAEPFRDERPEREEVRGDCPLVETRCPLEKSPPEREVRAAEPPALRKDDPPEEREE